MASITDIGGKVTTGIGLTAEEFYFGSGGSGDPIPPVPAGRTWTPNYSGVGSVQITEWQPSENYQISGTFNLNRNNTIVGSAEDGANEGYIFITLDRDIEIGISGNNQRFSFGDIVRRDIDFVFTVNGQNLTLTMNNITHSTTGAFGRLSYIGRWSGAGRLANGQIRNLRLTDLQNEQNSRFYPSIIRSEDMPTDLTLVDELDSPIDQNIDMDFRNWRSSSTTNTTQDTFTPTRTSTTGVYMSVGRAGVQYTLEFDYDIPSLIQVIASGSGTSAGLLLTTLQAGSGRGAITFIMPDSDQGIYFRGPRPSANIPFTIQNVRLFIVTNGALTEFPEFQLWVPVLMANQAYLGGFSQGNFVRGVNVHDRQLTSLGSSIIPVGSWGTARPTIGSNFLASGVVLRVESYPSGSFSVTYAIANGTDAEIQAAFEYPNVFDIQPFDRLLRVIVETLLDRNLI